MKLGQALFWDVASDAVPSLKGARSTAYYGECERILLEDFVPELPHQLLLKTDLWNEAKSTEILAWIRHRGARVVGIDISLRTVAAARWSMGEAGAHFVVADVRALSFAPAVFDVVYSMGTIEHFPEYRAALAELYAALRPGGIAIIGVPNKCDPFLRPALIYLLTRIGRYPYGPEKSFTPQALRKALEDCGFRVYARTGVLFIPGWLRLLDLWCHTRRSPLGPGVSQTVRPFAWLYRNVPAIRQLSYMTVAVAKK